MCLIFKFFSVATYFFADDTLVQNNVKLTAQFFKMPKFFCIFTLTDLEKPESNGGNNTTVYESSLYITLNSCRR